MPNHLYGSVTAALDPEPVAGTQAGSNRIECKLYATPVLGESPNASELSTEVSRIRETGMDSTAVEKFWDYWRCAEAG